MSCAGKQTQAVAHAAVSVHAGVSGLARPSNSATAPAQPPIALAALIIGIEGHACAGAAERQRKRPVEAAAGHADDGKVGTQHADLQVYIEAPGVHLITVAHKSTHAPCASCLSMPSMSGCCLQDSVVDCGILALSCTLSAPGGIGQWG
jgi:hypothetical protein